MLRIAAISDKSGYLQKPFQYVLKPPIQIPTFDHYHAVWNTVDVTLQ